MKLRFVKFLTSRENEIEKKEGGGQSLPLRALPPPGQAAARATSPAPISSSLHHSPSPSTRPTSPHPPPPSFPSATDRESSILQLSSPQLFRFSPSFFIKLPKQQSVAAVAPSLPTQLFCLTIACGAQLAAPLPLHPIGCRGSSPVLMASSLWRVEP